MTLDAASKEDGEGHALVEERRAWRDGPDEVPPSNRRVTSG